MGQLRACYISMMRAWFMDSYDGTDKLRLGEAPGCYRITPAGQRAFKEARASRSEAA